MGVCQTSPPPAVLLDGEEDCEIQQVLAHRERSNGKQQKHQLIFFVSWKGMGPEDNELLSESELMIATEVVQNHLDTLSGYRSYIGQLLCGHASSVGP